MPHSIRPKFALLAWLLALLCSCTTIDRLNAPTLAGAPASSALVLVRVEATMFDVRGETTRQTVVGGTLQSIGDGALFHSTGAAGYVVFSDLPPGAYRLWLLRTTWLDGPTATERLYTVPQDSSRAYDLELRVGEPCFLGVVAVHHVQTLSVRSIEFELRDRAKAEPEAWKWFARVYASSPWAALASRAPSATCTRR